MRVTNSMLLQSTIDHLGRSAARLQSSQDQLVTGKALTRPSDNPGRASSAMKTRSAVRRSEHQARSLDDARSWLDMADASLSTGLDLLNRVKQLTVQASNTGALDSTSRAALASEVLAIRGELLGVANTQYLGRSIFAGTVEGPAYDATASYLGNDGTVRREIASDVTVDVNLTGVAVFGDQAAPEGDMFAVLERLAAAITSGDSTTIANEHVNLESARDRMTTAAGTVGARGSRLETVRWDAERRRADLNESLSELEDIDMAEAIMAVRANENAYKASLQAAAKILPPSLVDYLR